MKTIFKAALSGISLTDTQIRTLIDAQGTDLDTMLDYARQIREQTVGNTAHLCAIINARSGQCSEDCAFCAQSSHHGGKSETYPLIDTATALDAARRAKEQGAARFSLVTSGKVMIGDAFAHFQNMVQTLHHETGLLIDVSPGILTKDQLIALKSAGASAYHHNLETARSFFPNVCTTHDYEEDVQAVKTAVNLGLYVCSGGIFGLGESWEQRVELAMTLKELNVDSVPVNFLHPIPGTPMENQPVLTPKEALKITALLRFLLPDKQIRICGGRETVFGANRKVDVLTAGASGLMIGDYLTVKGSDAVSDLDEIKKLGMTVSK